MPPPPPAPPHHPKSPHLDPPPNRPSQPPRPPRPSLNPPPSNAPPPPPPPPLGAFGPLLLGGGVAYRSEETSPRGHGHSGSSSPQGSSAHPQGLKVSGGEGGDSHGQKA